MSTHTIQELYQQALRTPSDISEHLPTLYRLARECDHVTEMGTHTGVSTRAFLAAQPQVLVCYDVLRQPAVDLIEMAASEAGRPRFQFFQADVLRIQIEPTDLLFIDTFHYYDQTKQELALHAERARKYLVFHDTTLYGQYGQVAGSRGIWPAIEEFLDANSHWVISLKVDNNNGLTVLSRKREVRRQVGSSRVTGSISACVVAGNEEARIEPTLQSLQGWTDQIIVIDHESEDQTVAIARRYTDCILTAPGMMNIGALRNLAIPVATGEWLFAVDADDQVPPRLGPILRQLVRERGHEFEALCIPVKHHFCGKWLRHGDWWPGYNGPQLLKAGHCHFQEGLHAGVSVDGRTVFLPPDDADLAIIHQTYNTIGHYLEKLNRHSDIEAETLLAEGASHSWECQLAHFVRDWQLHYEQGRADLDGMDGFVLAFMSAFYRFAARAKLRDLRRLRGDLPDHERVPGSLREMLEFMAHVVQSGAERWLDRPTAGRKEAPATLVPLLWRAPIYDTGGCADASRNLVLALIEAEESVLIAPEPLASADARLPAETRANFDARTVPADSPVELCVRQMRFPPQPPTRTAHFNIARVMFETDWLPSGADIALNAFDRIWVPSEFNRETFVKSGVSPEKLAVIPEAIDAAVFAVEAAEPWPLPGEEAYRFLSVFDWTLRKGWDVLLEAFASEFGSDPYVGLILKVWSSLGYTLEEMQAQADALLRSRLGKGLSELPNIHFWVESLSANDLPRIYHAVEAVVLPTRGEGWCRPLMEAMAAGLPTIATAWSGVTAFHNDRVGYPLKHRLVPVSPAAARELPQYAGHCWAEPDVAELRRLMRQLVDDPQTARGRALAARGTVDHQYSRRAVGRILREELAHCRRLAALPDK
jgi:glycosyltransferase involved in cell wall biosynthesis